MAGQFRASRGSLAAALRLAAIPVSERQTQRIPALGSVRLTAERAGLAITATTFDGTITTWIEATAEGEVAVPLEALAALVRHFASDAEIAITADDRAATITAGNSRFGLPVFPIADLLEPLVLCAETGRVELDARIARELFTRPAFAAADDVSRAYLNGIFLYSAADHLVAVAADGFRFCRIAVPTTSTLSTDRSLIIPNAMVKTIDRLLANISGNVTLRRSERLFAVEGAGFVVVSKRIDATYPDYERWIPSGATNVVTTNRIGLHEALARFTAVADPQIRPHDVSVRWDARGFFLRAGGSEDCLAADVEGEGETAVQVRYLAESVGAARGDNVRISIAERGGMILVTDPDDGGFVAGQMPIRPRLL